MARVSHKPPIQTTLVEASIMVGRRTWQGDFRLLVADRSSSFVDLLGHAVKAAGADVFRATDSGTAWRYLSRGFVHAAVLDLTLRPRTACELVPALRKLTAPHSQIPVIATTALIRRGELGMAKGAGIDLVMTKPVSTETIVSRLVALLAARIEKNDDVFEL